MTKQKILIFPAGAENALEIYDSLRFNVNCEVYGASGKKDYAEYLYPEGRYIEGDFYITHPDFVQIFEALIREYAIDIVIPTHDTIALYLAQHRELFSARILVADAETALICREKRKTYELFANESFCPTVYSHPGQVKEVDFPVFKKPNVGAGGVGACVIRSYSELVENSGEDDILCEYLPGREITADCFTNRKGELTFVGARSRDRIQMGIAFRSTTVELTEEIACMAKVINERLKFFGAWYFQAREDVQGKYKLMEVSCRQSGTMTLYRHMGINFPLLGIFELMGTDTSYVKLPGVCQIERRLYTSFSYHLEYEVVYIDFDDTIVANGKVIGPIVHFLYQCVNSAKKIVLLTRHEGELKEIFRQCRLSETLFDEIIHISFAEEKTDYIKPDKAVFIDNSFEERKKVSDAFHIPVFDVDAVDMLIAEECI